MFFLLENFYIQFVVLSATRKYGQIRKAYVDLDNQKTHIGLHLQCLTIQPKEPMIDKLFRHMLCSKFTYNKGQHISLNSSCSNVDNQVLFHPLQSYGHKNTLELVRTPIQELRQLFKHESLLQKSAMYQKTTS